MNNQNTKHFSIAWDDLIYEKQEQLKTEVATELMEMARIEGGDFKNHKWNDPKPRTWQEACCRIYAIESIMWSEYDRGEPEAEVPTSERFADWLKDYLEERAEIIIKNALQRIEGEINYDR